MEAACYLGYGPPPSIFIRMPSTIFTAPASTKLHCGFKHSLISVSRGFTHRRRCHRFYSVGPLALKMTSGNETGGGKLLRGAVGASLALACALGIIGYSCKMNSKATYSPQAPRKIALKPLLDVTVSLASKEGRKFWDGLLRILVKISSRNLLPPSKDEIDQLKEDAVNLMKRGKPDEALSMLKNEHEKCKNSYPNSEPDHNMTMAVVEILICQGKYNEALDLLSDDHQKFSDLDLRPTLYKAISLTMLDRDTEAKELWEEFASHGGIDVANRELEK